jgi:hypothetical protein
MAKQKLQFKPGVNKEISKNSGEPNWVDSDKVRFRQGYPEKIGGWQRISSNTFTGVCRSLHQWVALDFSKYTGVGTHAKFYVEKGGDYYDITPLRLTATLGSNPIATANTSKVVTITHSTHGATVGSYVTLSDVANPINNVPITDLNKEHVITEIVDANSYKIEVATTANGDGTGGVTNNAVVAKYQVNIGPEKQIPERGFESNSFNEGDWNGDGDGSENLRVWNQANFGEDLVVGPRGGELYYWDTSAATLDGTAFTGTRVVPLKNVNNGAAVSLASNPFATVNTSPTVTVTDATLSRVYEVGQHVTFANAGTVNNIALNGRFKIQTVDSAANTFTITGGTNANSTGTGGGGSVTAQYELSAEVPVVHDSLLISDASRFVFCFGCNAFGDSTEAKNPMLIRWSDQEDVYDWRPRSTNQAGDLQLSQGTKIVAAIQSRQEILVFTDSSVYSLQYVGAPVVWSSQLVGSNISVASSKAVAYANGVAYWMGNGKFYKYDGTVQPLRCDVQKFLFNGSPTGSEVLDINQQEQVFAGTLEEFHEIWWFYSAKRNGSVAPNRYVVYNYAEDIWYHGILTRSAWLDSAINNFPLAATGSYNLVEHENGLMDNEGSSSAAFVSSIRSNSFTLDDGDRFMHVDKILPDISFGESRNGSAVTIYMLPSDNPGAGYYNNVTGNALVNPPDAFNNEGSQARVTYTNSLNARNTTGTTTQELSTRYRGRDMALVITDYGSRDVKWQLGTPIINLRPDGRRGS